MNIRLENTAMAQFNIQYKVHIHFWSSIGIQIQIQIILLVEKY